jgi:3-phosphoshikimate 1-carboxyvinyltransferase
MASGATELVGALRSDDTDALARALRALGAAIEPREAGFAVGGVAGQLAAGPGVLIHLGDGGTPTRFAMALAAFAPRRVTIDGSARMRERPVADGVELLRQLGVRVEWAEARVGCRSSSTGEAVRPSAECSRSAGWRAASS